MSYQIHDWHKTLGPGPSSGGLHDLYAFIDTLPEQKAKNLRELRTHGFCRSPLGLKQEIKMWRSKAKKSAQSTLDALAKDATKAKHIIIISH